MSIALESKPASPPRELLVNDEGNSALHFIDSDAPPRNWSIQGPGRDLQLIGHGQLLRSQPQGFIELDLARHGAVVRDVRLTDLPGGVESARRLANGNTVVAGNGADGAFLWELDRSQQPVQGHQLSFPGVEKVRLVRGTEQASFLFCSEKQGRNLIHEATWEVGARVLFEIPVGTPADSMVKVVRSSANVLTVSTGYAASVLRIDPSQKAILQTIGGKAQPEPNGHSRGLSPFFFSGFQQFENGDCLVSNWQGHSAGKNGQGLQLLRYDADGRLLWAFDQTQYPALSSINNVIVLDGLDTQRLHDEPRGVLEPVAS